MKQLILALLLINLTACSSMQTVSISKLEDNDEQTEIVIGDRVEVITRDSEKMEFAVTEINGLGLGGKFGFIPYQNMRRLSVQKPGSSGEGPDWVWVALGIAALVALIAAADSVTVCSGTPCPGD